MNGFRIEKMVLGMIRTNCYFLIQEVTKETILIDPADGANWISAQVTKEQLKPVAILLTHGHFDHTGAAESLRSKYGIKIYMLEEEVPVAEDPMANLSGQWAKPFSLKADVLLKNGQILELAGFRIGVLHTPGHTIGSACYYLPQEKVLFSGDTIFQESVGRTDFPTGSAGALSRSVKGLLSTLPEDVRVYPGHEGETDIAHEKRYNPYA
ncbi:MAG: MBL fold metallo-hydrolase [Candidatus Limivivens sp.]|nr:MBL fold metallo-hydrolase [Candidatus Limivivens sp.]